MSSAVPMSGRRQRPMTAVMMNSTATTAAMPERMQPARDHRVDVGVGGAGDEVAVVEQGRVLVEPDADGLQGEVDARR